MEEDINSQNNQQHTGQQMAALEKFNQFRRVDRIQMEQEIVLRQKLIAHGTEIDRIKKAIEPDNRQQENKNPAVLLHHLRFLLQFLHTHVQGYFPLFQ